jgi:hypothetical protein
MKTINFNLLGVVDAYNRCIKEGNTVWEEKHLETIKKVLDILPHGSGIDCKWCFEYLEKSVIMSNSFHVMDENGYYDGYIDFNIVLDTTKRDTFGDMVFKIVGRFRKYQDIKDYLYDMFNTWFSDIDKIENIENM